MILNQEFYSQPKLNKGKKNMGDQKCTSQALFCKINSDGIKVRVQLREAGRWGWESEVKDSTGAGLSAPSLMASQKIVSKVDKVKNRSLSILFKVGRITNRSTTENK